MATSLFMRMPVARTLSTSLVEPLDNQHATYNLIDAAYLAFIADTESMVEAAPWHAHNPSSSQSLQIFAQHA